MKPFSAKVRHAKIIEIDFTNYGVSINDVTYKNPATARFLSRGIQTNKNN